MASSLIGRHVQVILRFFAFWEWTTSGVQWKWRSASGSFPGYFASIEWSESKESAEEVKEQYKEMVLKAAEEFAENK